MILRAEPAEFHAALVLVLGLLREPVFAPKGSRPRSKECWHRSARATTRSTRSRARLAAPRARKPLFHAAPLGGIARGDHPRGSGRLRRPVPLPAELPDRAERRLRRGRTWCRCSRRPFASFRNKDAPLPVPAEPEAPAAPGVYLVDAGRPMATARVRVGFVGFKRDNPDRVAVHVLLEYLGSELAASRLDRVLRIERGLELASNGRARRGRFLQRRTLASRADPRGRLPRRGEGDPGRAADPRREADRRGRARGDPAIARGSRRCDRDERLGARARFARMSSRARTRRRSPTIARSSRRSPPTNACAPRGAGSIPTKQSF